MLNEVVIPFFAGMVGGIVGILSVLGVLWTQREKLIQRVMDRMMGGMMGGGEL